MNQVISTYTNHRSIRSYLDKDVSDEYIDLIVKSAQHAPSSINGQQVSIIAVRNKDTKKKIAELAGGQPWIDEAPVFLLFALDFYRAKIACNKNSEEIVITQSLESIMVGSVDVGIAMGNAIGAAESLGLGIVPIGAVRNEPEEFIKLLNLPEYVYPVAGLVVGYPKDNSALKPRLPKEAVFHEESYNHDLESIIDRYDEEISKYMIDRTNGEDDKTWSQGISNFYKFVYFPKVYTSIKNQGFDNNK